MAYVPPHQRNRAANPQADGEKDGARAVDSRGGYPSGDRDRGGKGEGRWNREGQEDAPAPPRRRGGGPVSAMAEGNGGDWRRRQDGRRSNSDEKKPTEVEIFGEIQSRSSAGIDFDNYDAIPVQLTGTNVQEIKPITRFSEAKLTDSLFDNLRRCGYDRPTPVQKHSIPIVVSGRDLMACAQTGSGKTCAFMVPCIESLLRSGPPANPSSRRPKPMPCGLVLAPTRELALQIHGESAKFAFDTGILCRIVYGGADIKEQREDLEKGCDILIATPGRLTDMGQRHMVELDLVQFFILDEADRMLDMGFEPQVRNIVMSMNLGAKSSFPRQSMMFSATFAKDVQVMAQDFLHDYVFITVGRVGAASELVKQHVIFAEDVRQKVHALSKAVKDHLPKDGRCIVFVETKKAADSLEMDLHTSGTAVTAIHGDRSQQEREEALHAFKTGANPVLVATDVAARGLDIPNVALVVNFDMPKQLDDYVHRIGRTGRAGRKGIAVAFVNDRCSYLPELRDLLVEAKQDPPLWFQELCGASRRPFGKGAGRGRDNKFGGQDLRLEGQQRAPGEAAPTAVATPLRTSAAPSAAKHTGWGNSGAEDAW